MIRQLAEKTTDVLLNNHIIEKEDYEIYQYGIEMILSNLMNLLTLLILTIILGSYWESVIFLIFLIPIRLYAGGYHANSYLKCNLVFLIFYMCVIGLKNMTPITQINSIGMMIMLSANIIIWKWAPVESEYNPLTEEEKNKYAKVSRWILAIETLVILVGFLMGNEWREYAYIGCLTTLVVAISIIISIIIGRKE
ncbi:MAG: accessory gene regulator B family protein [Cellulosilyticaceae bacterium]